ncbi:MAG: 1,4-alpha-glucan branching protein GlgB [Clostridia bacterium]|nr:1,4-alpha-glucan branching protein GlgB [Clostridia bacterium]
MRNNQAVYYFHEGTNYRAFSYFGIHAEKDGLVFRTYAPNARAVSIVGDFNGWNPEATPMSLMEESGGIWEGRLNYLEAGAFYKFAITTADGKVVYKADPYATYSQTAGDTASIYFPDRDYAWHDSAWIKHRKKKDALSEPLNIYEVHAGSWRRHEDGSFYSYRDLARELVPYVKEMGYTHIEFLPLSEHPFDGSWGYQSTGYYAPTSRYGTPTDLRYLIDTCHQHGIGVIMDWVPAHFPKDEFGLYRFDGTPLYEYKTEDRSELPSWGTCRFDVGSPEVRSFLISSLTYWIEAYHIDGFRVDAVSSMIYLDYDKNNGEWTPNCYGGNECLEAIDFFKKLNWYMQTEYPSIVMIAEESTAFPKVSHRVEDGGLGFRFKWNMGWMNDTLRYISTDPLFRKHHQNLATFSFSYAFFEHYILSISHDEMVHGKCSLIGRMPGEYNQKFDGARGYLGYMFAHPGKKLLFMGSEFAQFIEWDYKKGLDFFLLDYDSHRKFQTFVRELNLFYLAHPQLWQEDFSEKGFSWIAGDDCENSVLAFRRLDRRKRELIAVVNFTPVKREGYLIGVNHAGEYQEVFNTDALRFGGSGVENEGVLQSIPMNVHGCRRALSLTLPPSGVIFLERVSKKEKSIRLTK